MCSFDLFFFIVHKKPQTKLSNPYKNMTGALTQIIATGALDSYLSSDANHTFWRSKYAKHTQFAMEHCSQPFSTPVAFGSECQVVLNRQGDLVHHQYIEITLPGIVACDLDKEKCLGLGGGSMFPAYMDKSCAPCSREDDMAMRDMNDDATDASSETGKRTRRDAWLRARYGHASALEGCEEAEDCPDALLPELETFGVTTSTRSDSTC